MLTFYVPGGIGDFSAMWEKLYPIALEREIAVQSAGDGVQRLAPFLDILTPLKNMGSGHFNTGMVLNNALPGGIDLRELPDGEYFLSCNAWMDAHKTVDSWCPGPTEYHYPMNISEGMRGVARALWSSAQLLKKNAPLIGIYSSAYGNSRHWNFWQTSEWFDLISKVYKETGATFVFIGASYDIDLGTLLYQMCLTEGIPAVNTIGELHIGSTVEVIRALDYFFVFPSGLGFLADVVNTPHVMWFPPHLPEMMTMAADPINVLTKQTQHRQFETSEEAFQNFKEVGIKFLGRRVVTYA